MANVSKSRALFIDSRELNHMVACKDSFTSLDSNNCIFIHMGDDSQVSSKGKGTIHLEHISFKNVLYVPYLTSSVLFVYQMIHIGLDKIVVFSPNDVEISNIAMRKLIVVGKAYHATKTYEFSNLCLIQILVPSELMGMSPTSYGIIGLDT